MALNVYRWQTGRPRDNIWSHFHHVDRSTSGPHHVAKCIYCNAFFPRGRIYVFRRHLAFECRNVLDNVKIEQMSLLAAIASKKKEKKSEGSSSNKKKKDSSQSASVSHCDSTEASASKSDCKQELDHSLMKFLVTCNIPFHVVENIFFREFIHNLREGYTLPSRNQLSQKLLWDEAAKIVTSMRTLLAQENNLTLALDGWTDSTSKKGLFAFTILTTNRQMFLHSLMDISDKRHTADFLTNKTVQILKEIGPEKFAAIVSDNSPNMQNLQVYISGLFSNIIGLRCIPQFINLITCDFLLHEWSRSILRQCQLIVVYFSAHTHMRSLLVKMRGSSSDIPELQSFVKTKWHTASGCIRSILKNGEILRKLVLDGSWPGNDNSDPLAVEVKTTVCTHQFWADAEYLHLFLSPLANTIIKLEDSTASLAECYRQLVCLAATIDNTQCSSIEFQSYCANIFAHRWDELMNGTDMYLLAYYLHPYLKGKGLQKGMFTRIVTVAAEIWKSTGHGKMSTTCLLSQLMKYRHGEKPYDLISMENFLCPLLWWRSMDDTLGPELRVLAVKLLSIMPHSALYEKSFSILNWIHSKPRNRFHKNRLEAIAKIYVYNVSQKLATDKSVASILEQYSISSDSLDEVIDDVDDMEDGFEPIAPPTIARPDTWLELRKTFDLKHDTFSLVQNNLSIEYPEAAQEIELRTHRDDVMEFSIAEVVRHLGLETLNQNTEHSYC